MRSLSCAHNHVVSANISAASSADAEAIAALHAASWRATYRGMLPQTFLERDVDDNRRRLWATRFREPAPGQVVWKAVGPSGLAGFACVLLDAHPEWGALLDNLHVAPELTGTGIGARLLDTVRGHVRTAAPGMPLHLWVLEANVGARRFYDRHGGVVAGHNVREILPGIRVPEFRYSWSTP